METERGSNTRASNAAGYASFSLGGFEFSRDEYFVHITWMSQGRRLTHRMPADTFLRAMMRCVAWNFFYGWVYFDDVFGTHNLYGQVEFFAGRFHAAFQEQELHHAEVFATEPAMQTCKAMLADWTNSGFDPFAAPEETGVSWSGKKKGSNFSAIERRRETCRRMLGLPGDAPLHSDANGHPINRAFADVVQDSPEIHAEPGFEAELHAVNLFAHLSRSDVTWNPSVTSVCKHSLFCPTTEEYVMPVKHANDRIEWFLQLSDQIEWQIEDLGSGMPRAKVVMKAGDIAAMPALIRHQGYARKRAMLLVWENADPKLPELYATGSLSPSMAEQFDTSTISDVPRSPG